MEQKFLIAIDQGTTGTKILLVDREGNVIAQSYKKHTQYHPKPGWVEHDPLEIWQAVLGGTEEVLEKASIRPCQIAAVGLANQGETVLWWDARTHLPLYRAVVWSCRRSQEIAARWENDGNWKERIAEKTGLRIDPYFSATKIRWMIDHVTEIQRAIENGTGIAGTLDSWLIWNMTGGKYHVTDRSTAARTLLMNIHTGEYDEEILAYLDIQRDWLPQIYDSIQWVGDPDKANALGVTSPDAYLGIEAPILVSLVDQPAALFGHLCIEPGSSKVTYGTGCFAYMNAGNIPPKSQHQLLSTVVWSQDGKMTYALDGGVYSAGSSLEWAQQKLQLFPDLDTLQDWSIKRLHHDRCFEEIRLFYIPALTGLGAPYWDSNVRGAFVGISHNTGKEEMAIAILEGIAQRVADVLEAMEKDVGNSVTQLRVDGGLTKNPYLMQFQADILGIPVEVPDIEEVTAMGVAFLTGIALRWWTVEELKTKVGVRARYEPRISSNERNRLREQWKEIIQLIRQMPCFSARN